MSQFRVVQPCAYVIDGAAIHHREPGALVDLSFKLAAELGDAVELVSPPRPPIRRKTKPVKDGVDRIGLAEGDCTLLAEAGGDGE